MKPAWDKLMETYKDSKDYLIADVDCTAKGKLLCQEHKVRGYPTLKAGYPDDLEDYKGKRDFDSLLKFVEEKLEPMCSPTNMDACDSDQLKLLKLYENMDEGELKAAIESTMTELKTASKDHERTMSDLQTKFTCFKKDKSSRIGLMKSVYGTVAASDEL